MRMDAPGTEDRAARRQRRLRLIAGMFAGLLALCTLFGNTLLTLTLPKVATQPAQSGFYSFSYQGTATIEPAEVRDLNGAAGWTVKEVFAREGDEVHLGQALAVYDNDDFRQQIEDEKANVRKLELSLETIKRDYIEAAKTDDQVAVLSAKTALVSAKIDIDTRLRHLAAMQEKLKSQTSLLAPFDGIVTAVGASAGLTGTPGMPDFRLSNKKQGFQFHLRVPSGIADAIGVGDAIDVLVTGKINRTVQGYVMKAQGTHDPDPSLADGQSDNAGSVVWTVSVKDGKLKGGEKVEVRLTQTDSKERLLIMSSAIRQDSSGAYVWVIETKKGPLGNAFYAVRRSVVVSHSDDRVAAIEEGLFDQDLVVVESSEPLMDGSQVRL